MAPKWSPREWLRNYYTRIVNDSLQIAGDGDLGRSALIVSPHQDDETLGCGGTIIRKIDAGAEITLVFMTDGRQSHGHLIQVEELVAIRRSEALAAGRTLGLDNSRIFFLDFIDGSLISFQNEATGRISAILNEVKPEEIYLPYAKEPPPDHYATNHIVLAALETSEYRAFIYEYPVWFWHHWPWVSISRGAYQATGSVLKNTMKSQGGLRLLWDFNYAVFVGDVLQRKQAALEQHQSQMTQLGSDPRWLTLGDVSKGEFLACFFQDYELFRHYQFDGRRKLSKPKLLTW